MNEQQKRLGEKETRRRTPFVLLAACFFSLASSLFAQEIALKNKLQSKDFPLVQQKRTAPIYVSDADFKVARIVAAALADDIEKVAGVKPAIETTNENLAKRIVVIGTLGKNALIEKLVDAKKLDVSKINGKWESFLIETIENPFPGVENALVIVGADRRGTAFGAFELSQRIGVSPWVWWADVAPEKRENVIIAAGKFVAREPSVKYRGIFLNDEDWGLQPWAARSFEPETGDIGPKTYAKIFELLLRLKANTCWAAMHEVTRAFNLIDGNAQTADDYAIVMGSSHAEPMLRNNVGEWREDKEKYNFVANERGVTAYWEERVRANGKYENIYTLGMRGIHDSPIQGTRSQAERIPVLEKIIATQRNLLAKHVDENIERIPQIFCPYKEVLADYRAGLKVPDDVTIVFPDDNFGYIRYFPSADERKRAGGFGVYYHISYLGRPLSYLWLNTTPPALIFEEMSKAYANGMRRFWMLNVGDLKPAEIGIEFFMQMAYDAEKWTIGNQHRFLKSWAMREFGARNAAEIAVIMDEYYRLGFQRKPEHLQFYLPKEPPRQSDLTSEEKQKRLEDYKALRKRAEAVNAGISPVKKDAFYELVLYPVRAAYLANERIFAAEIAEELKAQNDGEALDWARRSINANREIESETKYFNEQLNGGKWRFMMSPEMNPGQWTSMRAVAPQIDVKDFENAAATSPAKKASPGRAENRQIISIEAENYTRAISKNGFGWQKIIGLGKTGDSVSVFPPVARTFAARAPVLEYRFEVSSSGDFETNFFLIPTQPLFPGGGLRLAFAIDDAQPQIVAVDQETEVSSAKWSLNVLNQTTITATRIRLANGAHVLRVFAVDTGVVLDKIVLHAGELPASYFGPAETGNF